MATGFGNWANTVEVHAVLKKIAQNEVQRLRPASRLAEVTSIDTDAKNLLVKFVGESNEVLVPFTSIAPSNIGQWVRVGGTTHDRYVEDVIGTTDTESRLNDAESHINSLMSSILGDEWSDDDDGESGGFIDQITNFFSGLGGGGADVTELIKALADNPLGTLEDAKNKINDMLQNAFGLIDPSRIPLIPISHLGSTQQTNILINNTFENAVTIEGDGIWEWDGTEGHGAPGSAKTTGSTSRKVLTSVEIPCTPTQSFDVSGWVKWSGVSVTGGNAFQIAIVTYNDSGSVVSEDVIQSITNPAPDGTWTQMTGTYVVPANIVKVRLRLIVTSGVQTGTVWFDDMVFKKTGDIQQGWVSGLTSTLSNIWSSFTGIFEKITGIPNATISTLTNWMTQLKQILSGVTLPSVDFPTLSQGLKAGLEGAVNTVNGFLLNLANAILSGIRRVPLVGGTIADRIADVISDLTGFSLEAQQTKNAVVAGATKATLESVTDQTSAQVQATVASLKAVADEQKARQVAYDLRGSAIFDGPLPSGDVTIPYHRVVTSMSLEGFLSGSTGAQTAGTAHTHPMGSATSKAVTSLFGSSLSGDIGVVVFSAIQASKYSSPTSQAGMPVAAFVAKSDTPRKTIAFRVTGNSGQIPSIAKIVLFRFNDQFDIFEQVGISNNFSASIVVDQYTWIFATLTEEYYPTIGELLAVGWIADHDYGSGTGLIRNYGLELGGFQPLPPYPNFPWGSTTAYGINGVPNSATLVPPPSFPLPARNEWINGYVPFAQIGPDVDAPDPVTPMYWYDDYSTSDVGNLPSYLYYNIYSSVSGGNVCRIQNSELQFYGLNDGYQGVTRKQEMNTPDMQCEGTVSGTISSVSSGLGILLDGAGNGIYLRVTNSAVAIAVTSGTDYMAGGSTLKTVTGLTNTVGQRWAVRHISTTGEIVGYRDGVEIIRTTKPWDSSAGVGYRRCGQYVARSAFTTSAAWADFLARDI